MTDSTGQDQLSDGIGRTIIFPMSISISSFLREKDNKQCFHNQFYVHLSAARNKTPSGHIVYKAEVDWGFSAWARGVLKFQPERSGSSAGDYCGCENVVGRAG